MNRQKYPEYFEAFWKSYPRYEDKFEAFNQWKRLKPDAALREDIREGIRHRKEAEKQADEGGEFFPSWPHASRFLKKRRWEDRFPLKKEKQEKNMKRSQGAQSATPCFVMTGNTETGIATNAGTWFL